MQSVGKSMSTSLTAPLVLMGGLAVKVFADFEQSMAKVQAVSGATGAEFQKLNTLAKDLGISTRFTATQVSDLMLNYSKLGFSSSEIEKITESTLQLALATGEDLATSAEVAGGTLRGFGIEATEMQRVVDVMALAFSSSALNLEKFSVAMPKVASLAAALGQSIETTTAQLGTLSDSNIEASTSATMLRNMFLKAKEDGFKMEDALLAISKSNDKAATSMQFFDKRATTVAITLANNIGKTKELAESLENAGGTAAKMAAIMDDTTTGSLMKLKSATEGLAISFGEVLSPFVQEAAAFVAALAIRFSKLSGPTKQIIVVVAALVAAIGPLIFVIGSLTVALGFLAANPIVLIITAIIVVIGLLVAAFFYVRNNAEQFGVFFYNLWVDIANNFIEAIKTIIKPFLYLYDLMGLPITGGINEYLDSFKLTATSATKEFQTLGEAFDDVKKKIGDLTSPDIEVGGISGGGEGVGAAAAMPTVDVSSLNIQLPKVEPIEIDVKLNKSGFDKAIEDIGNFGTMAQQKAKIIGDNISDALTTGLQNMVTQSAVLMGEFIANMATGESAPEDFGKQFLVMIGGFMKEFGAAMIGIGVAQSAIAAAISAGPAGAPLAIVGGIALVAAGAVLSNVSKKGVGGGGGGVAPPPAPTYSNNGFTDGVVNSTNVKISGRDLILVQERERAFRR